MLREVLGDKSEALLGAHKRLRPRPFALSRRCPRIPGHTGVLEDDRAVAIEMLVEVNAVIPRRRSASGFRFSSRLAPVSSPSSSSRSKAQSTAGLRRLVERGFYLQYADDLHMRARIVPSQILSFGRARPGVLYSASANSLILRWCGRRGSNPHDFRHGNLNPARLPIPPRPRQQGGPAARLISREIRRTLEK
jgi:hypothetical protein